MNSKLLPILYSFRRCPYAMRARMALRYAGQRVQLREVLLKNKPQALLQASAKGTVPVLVFADGRVIDESWDILLWATRMSDPDEWRGRADCHLEVANDLIRINDSVFKGYLDQYKYADRFPESSKDVYRAQGEDILVRLEERLQKSDYLLDDRLSIADIGIFPFVRQFASVDLDWFRTSRYQRLGLWLDAIIDSDLFKGSMGKYPPWKEGDSMTVL